MHLVYWNNDTYEKGLMAFFYGTGTIDTGYKIQYRMVEVVEYSGEHVWHIISCGDPEFEILINSGFNFYQMCQAERWLFDYESGKFDKDESEDYYTACSENISRACYRF